MSNERFATDTVEKRWFQDGCYFSIVRVEEEVRENYYRRVGYLLNLHSSENDKVGMPLYCSEEKPFDSKDMCHEVADEYILNQEALEDTYNRLLKDVNIYN